MNIIFNRTNKSGHRAESMVGAVYVELAILLPLTLVMVWGFVSIDTSFENSQNLSLVSRELANAAFRECNGYSDSGRLTTCIEEVATRIQNTTSAVLPDLTVGISVYRCSDLRCTGSCVGVVGSPDNCSCSCQGAVLQSATATSGPPLTPISRFSVPSVQASFSNQINDFGQVIIGEAFFNESHFGMHKLYEATVY